MRIYNNLTTSVSGIFMAGFLLVMVSTALVCIWQNRHNTKYENIQGVVQGKWSLLYEDLFNEKIATYEFSKNSWGALNYALYKEGRSGVLIGDQNWLFTREEFDYAPDHDKQLQEKIQFITALNGYLKEKNIELVIAPVPAKARIYKGQLGRYIYPSYKEPVYANFLQGLQKKNIPTVDILSAMEGHKTEQLFLKTDTHWTSEGARIAASQISDYVRQHFPDLDYEHMQYSNVVQNQNPHTGDLLNYIPAGGLSEKLGLTSEPIAVITSTKADNNDADASDALFSDQTPPITLVGTSYSANTLWNFEGYLKEYLQTDILNAADEGLGPFETMKKYLENDAFKQTPPRLLIWEIPERYLTMPYDLKTEFYSGA